MSIARLHTGSRLSRIVIHNDTVYLTGCIAERTKGKSVRELTREILGTIERLLAEAGSDKTRILTTSICLSDIATYTEMNAEWDSWVVEGHTPARDVSGETSDLSDVGHDRLHRRARLTASGMPVARKRCPSASSEELKNAMSEIIIHNGETALSIARDAEPSGSDLPRNNNPTGIKAGAAVTVNPDDVGRDPVEASWSGRTIGKSSSSARDGT